LLIGQDKGYGEGQIKLLEKAQHLADYTLRTWTEGQADNKVNVLDHLAIQSKTQGLRAIFDQNQEIDVIVSRPTSTGLSTFEGYPTVS
jgi:hypothetical protein